MQKSCAFIVIDSGFSRETLAACKKVLGAWDLTANKKYEAKDCLTSAQLDQFAGDPMGHGSIVVQRLLRLEPDAKLILIKAFDEYNDVLRTSWCDKGQVAWPGWCEGYVWAVKYARARGMVSVGNCSFGSYRHAMDGSGWEALQVGSCTGPGKPGHILIAAAGYGDNRAVHGAISLLGGHGKTFIGRHEGDAVFNFWFGLKQPVLPKPRDWKLEAWLNGNLVYLAFCDEVPANMWNGRQQLTFHIEQGGDFDIEVSRPLTNTEEDDEPLRVDVWSEAARFVNWVSTDLLPEPASFNSVLTVGLRASCYTPNQEQQFAKPEVLLAGGDQISFRIPEVVVAVGKLLREDPSLDIEHVRARLPKFWKNGSKA